MRPWLTRKSLEIFACFAASCFGLAYRDVYRRLVVPFDHAGLMRRADRADAPERARWRSYGAR
jgi:hypothetical protein